MQEFLGALQPFWRDLQQERGRYRMEQQSKERERDYAEWESTRATREQIRKMIEEGKLRNPEKWAEILGLNLEESKNP